jgi:hypothetical protein
VLIDLLENYWLIHCREIRVFVEREAKLAVREKRAKRETTGDLEGFVYFNFSVH